jgi:uncharacterized protein DUF2877
LRSMRATLPRQRSAVLEASSVGRTAHERLLTGERGVIESAFDGAINVQLAGGLVCLVPEAAGRGPLNVTLRLPANLRSMGSLGLARGDTVTVRNSSIEFGACYQVNFASALVYSPNLPLAPLLSDKRIAHNIEVARETALRIGKMTGLGCLLAMMNPAAAGPSATTLNVFASAAAGRIASLEAAFRAEDSRLIDDAVGELVGLGPGLTPSSDDVLAGVVLFCVLYSKSRRVLQRRTELISLAIQTQCRGRTTRVSEEFLEQAALGNGNEAAMMLCEAVLTGRPDVVEERTRAVLAIGETSGTDIALGVVLGGVMCTGRPVRMVPGGSR